MSNKQPVKSVFENLQKSLHQWGFNTYLMPESEENIIEQLLVSLNPEGQSEEDFPPIQIMFINDMVKKSDLLNGKDLEMTYILQLFLALPVTFPEEKLLDAYKLISVFSRIIPTGYLGIGDDGVFFRYTILSDKREVNSKLATESVKFTSFFVSRFYTKIKELSTGQKSLETLLEESSQELMPQT